jgi:hypothetical protein
MKYGPELATDDQIGQILRMAPVCCLARIPRLLQAGATGWRGSTIYNAQNGRASAAVCSHTSYRDRSQGPCCLLDPGFAFPQPDCEKLVRLTVTLQR